VALSLTTPIGFVFSNLESLSFRHPSLGLCEIEFDGVNKDLIDWKEKFESELQYGSQALIRKEETLQEHELSVL
jgi:hypothetical protein